MVQNVDRNMNMTSLEAYLPLTVARSLLGGPQPVLFMAWASEHQKRKMDTFADFTTSVVANEKGRILENPIVINSTCCICLRQNHSRPSTPHGSQDYSLAPHTPAESQKSGAPWKTVKNDASDFRCRNFCSAASCVRPMWWTCCIFSSLVCTLFQQILMIQSSHRCFFFSI